MVDEEIMASLSVSLSLPPPFSPSLPPSLPLSFSRRNAAVRCAYRQRNRSDAPRQHNPVVSAPGLCHEISGRKVVSIAWWRRWAFLELLIGSSESRDSRSLIIQSQSLLSEPPYKRKAKHTLNPLPTYLPATHTLSHIHTHTLLSICLNKAQHSMIGKDRLTLAKDWSGKKNIFEYLNIPQFPLLPKER